FVCRLLHLKIISLKNPLQIGLCNKAATNTKINERLFFKAPTYFNLFKYIFINRQNKDRPTISTFIWLIYTHFF
ncbi:hypothetical protein B4S26_03615, partial [Acinetobacter baumannii]